MSQYITKNSPSQTAHSYMLIFDSAVNEQGNTKQKELISWRKRSKLFAALLVRLVQCPYFGSTPLPNPMVLLALP